MVALFSMASRAARCGALLWCLLTPGDTAARSLPDEARLRTIVDELVAPLIGTELAGCTVGVVTPDARLVVGYGSVGDGGGTPDGATLYEIGSITKAITGTLLADAVKRGELKLDDPLADYAPEGVEIVTNGEPITLRHLATHASGLPRIPANLEAETPDPYAAYSAEDAWRQLDGWKPDSAPGDYAYSNFGMGLLGIVLERATGKTYAELVRERITTPLGMADTVVELDEEQSSRFATPHVAVDAVGTPWRFGGLVGCGGVRSSVDDLLKLLAVVAKVREDGATTAPIAQALKLATVRHGDAGNKAIGLGWHRAVDKITWWHTGQTGGFAGWASSTDVPRGNGFINVVVLSNTATGKASLLGERIVQRAFGIDAPAVPLTQTVAVATDTLRRYEGRYALSPAVMIDVRLKESQLWVQLTGQPELPVYATDAHTFEYKAVPAKLVFEVSGDEGFADSLTLYQSGAEMESPRIGDVGADPPKLETVDLPEELLGRYAGEYELQPGMVFTIRVVDGGLNAQLTGQPAVPVYAVSETDFEYKVVKARLSFEAKDGEPAESLTLFQFGQEMRAKRID